MNFTLSLPPSTNAIWKIARNRMYKTAEAKAWEEEAFYVIKNQHRKEIMGNVYVGLEFFLKYDRDVDNMKLIMDVLAKAGIYKNDSQVTHLNIKKYKDNKNPRVEVVVAEL